MSTQMAWDEAYLPHIDEFGHRSNHIFEAQTILIRSADRRLATVVERTALTATIVWADNKQREVIAQFDPAYRYLCPRGDSPLDLSDFYEV